MEEIYTNAYAAIREDPVFKPTEKSQDWKAESLKFKVHRRTHAERKAAIQAKIGDEARKAESREKVIVGGAILAAMKAGAITRERITELIDATVLNAPTHAFLRERKWAIGAEDPAGAEDGQKAA